MSGNPGQPQQNPQELFQQAVRSLEPAIPELGQKIQESFRNSGNLSPQLSGALSQLVQQYPQVRDRVSFILHYSAQFSRENTPHRGSTVKDNKVLPLPGQAPQSSSSQRMPTPSPSPSPDRSGAPQNADALSVQSFFTWLRQTYSKISSLEDSQRARAVQQFQGQCILALRDAAQKNPTFLNDLFQQLTSIELTDDFLFASQSVLQLVRSDQALSSRFFKEIPHLETKTLLTPTLKKNGIAVTSFLAQGGMGAVYKGTRKVFGKNVGEVVIKVIQNSDPESRAGFQREAQTLATVKGAHIVPLYHADILSNNGDPYLVMEYIYGPEGHKGPFDGDTLLRIMQRNQAVQRPFPLEATIILQYAFALGVQETHALGVVHRDLKPANSLISPKAARALDLWDREEIDDRQLVDQLYQLMGQADPLVLLSDFGLAKHFDRTQQPPSVPSSSLPKLPDPNADPQFTFTAGGGVCGTPQYIAPESALGDSFQEKTDLYALGAIFAEFIEGHFLHAFKGKGALAIMAETAQLYENGTASLISADDPKISKSLKRLSPEFRKIISQKIAQLTSLDRNHPEKRGTIDEVVETWKKIVDANSPEGRRAAEKGHEVNVVRKKASEEKRGRKKAEKKAEVATTGRKKAWGAAGLAFAAFTALGLSVPPIMKSGRKDDFLKAHAQTTRNSEDLVSSKQWNDVITLLNAEKEKVLQNEDLEESEKKPLLARLEGQIAYARTMQTAEQLEQEITSLQERAKPAIDAASAGVLRTVPGIQGDLTVVLQGQRKCLSPLQNIYARLQEREQFLNAEECPLSAEEKNRAKSLIQSLLLQASAGEVLIARPVALYRFRAGDESAIPLYQLISERTTDAQERAVAESQVQLIRSQQQHMTDLRQTLETNFPRNPAQRSEELTRERRRILLELAPLLRGRQIDDQLRQSVSQVLRFLEEGYYETADIPGDSSWKADAVELFSHINPESRERFQSLIDDFDRWFRDFTRFRQQVGAQAWTPQAMPAETPHEEAMDHLARTWISLERLHSSMGERPLPVHDFVTLFSDPRWAVLQDSHEIVKWFIQRYGGIGHLLDQLKAHPGYARGMQHFLATAVLIFEQTERAVAEGSIPALGPRQKSNFNTTMLHDLSLLFRVKEITGDYLTAEESESTFVRGDYLASPLFYQRIQEVCLAAPDKAEKLNVISQFHYILVHSGQNPAREARFLSLIQAVGLTRADLQRAGIDLR